MADASSIGLRARKRAAMAAAIEQAAVRLAGEHGYAAVTVEMICAEALVSPATFYNYFGTKDAVFLGSELPWPSDDAVEAFLAGTGPIVAELVGMINSAFEQLDVASFSARRRVIAATPELSSREYSLLAGLEARLLTVTLQRLQRSPRHDPPSTQVQAQMVVTLAVLVHRQLVLEQFDGEFRWSSAQIDRKLALIHDLSGAR